MLEPKHLRNPPIVEAAIALDVTPPINFEVKQLLKLKPLVFKDYPVDDPISAMMSKIDFKPDGQTSTSSSPPTVIGYRFFSSDKLFVAQVRPDVFSFSRLKPYTTWENLKGEARKFWNEYKTIVSPISTIKKISLRFINRLEFTLPSQTTDYLTHPPRSPSELQGFVTGFLSQINLHDAESGIDSTIIQFLEPQTKPEFASLILDIQVSKQIDYAVDETRIWDTLDLLRAMKNRIFFSSITEKTFRMCE